MIKKTFFILVVFTLFAGCNNKLSLLAPYKEMVSVYGLLDQDDATHYIRIQRVFAGEGSAYTFAQNPDSVYFKPGELTVKLQYWKNGVKQTDSTLREEIIQEDTGIFSRNELAYKTNMILNAKDSTALYKLVIHSNKTGKEFTAQTGLIGAFQLIAPTTPINYLQKGLSSSTKVNIVPGNNGSVNCVYNSPANSGVCSLNIILVYTENGSNVQKTADIGLGTLYPATTSPTLGGSREDFSYVGASLLSDMAAVIPVDNNTARTLTNVQFVLSAGGVDLALYNQVNASTSISQNKASYSNINGGVGIFSCRHKIILQRDVTDQAKDTISANKQTCKLRFLNHLNSLSPCN